MQSSTIENHITGKKYALPEKNWQTGRRSMADNTNCQTILYAR